MFQNANINLDIKKITYILGGVLGILLIFLVVSLFNKKDNTEIEVHPVTVVCDYFEEMCSGNFTEANNYYLEPNIEFYNSLMNEEFFYKEYWAHYGIEPNDENIDEDTATVNVTINKLDYVSIMLDTKQKLINAQNGEQTYTIEELENLKNKYIVEAFRNNVNKVVTNTYDINLIKDENGNWKILCDNIIKDILFGNVSN